VVPIVSGVRRSMRPMEPIYYPIDPLQAEENEGQTSESNVGFAARYFNS